MCANISTTMRQQTKATTNTAAQQSGRSSYRATLATFAIAYFPAPAKLQIIFLGTSRKLSAKET